MDLSITNPSHVSTDDVHTELSRIKDPKKIIAEMRKEFGSKYGLLKGTKKDRRVLRAINKDYIDNLTQELGAVEQELEKYVLFEKLTHYEEGLERLIAELYYFTGIPEKLQELQMVFGFRNAMWLFKQDYDAYVQYISYLEIAKEHLEESIEEAVLLSQCNVRGEDPEVLLRKYRSTSKTFAEDQ